MIIRANNTIDGFNEAKSYLLSLEDSCDKELHKESPLLIVFENLKCDEAIPVYNGTQFKGIIDYSGLIKQGNDFVYEEFKHYEHLLNNQVSEIISYLKDFPLSKRAIINAWSDEQKDLGKSAECLVYILFRLTKNGLDIHVQMRANNAMDKALLNFHIFGAIQGYVAKELGLKTGKYYHYANSYHIYK